MSLRDAWEAEAENWVAWAVGQATTAIGYSTETDSWTCCLHRAEPCSTSGAARGGFPAT